MISNVNEIDTPALIVDERIARNNIASLQKHCNSAGLKLRPHIKTHKSVRMAKLQLEAGAAGINCQKIGEAEIMANAGCDDILITFNILGEAKLSRLKALHEKISKLTVVADNSTVIAGLGDVFVKTDHPLNIMIECDTGAGRCGVQSPDEAVGLAESISTLSGLKFAGLMTYPAAGDNASAAQFMKQSSAQLNARGIQGFEVSTGGTPDMWQSQAQGVFTEYRAGTYIYNDRSLLARGTCNVNDCAGVVLATVVSMPTPERAVIDAGSKALTSDLLGLDGHGHVIEYPDSQIVALSEEHGTLKLNPDSALRIGDRIRIIPNHVCVVSNLFDSAWLKELSGAYVPLPIDARGCVW
ncbi:MAG: D-TA family PLP-dependent enzyme [Granulosicoccus sp.]|nr:D-TA family PLP-dependent enzyme [Granulosicoccus sp.]